MEGLFLIFIELHKNDGKSFNVLRDADISPRRATVGVTMLGFISTITAEPIHFITAIATGIKFGAGIQDALIFDKVCLYELNYSEDVCENLSLYEEEEINVQETVNRFNLGKSWANSVMSIIASLFVGGFTDMFGFKMTLSMSFIGVLLIGAVDWVFYIFLENIPLYFLYVHLLFNPMISGYYLALYGLINRFVTKDKLATRISFADGGYTIGWIIGVTPSAPLFRALGYYGVYATHDVLYILAFLYHLIFVREYPSGKGKEPREEKIKEDVDDPDKSLSKPKNVMMLAKAGTVDVIKDLFNTLLKPRPHHMRPLIILTFMGMTCYYTTINDYILTYAYMYLMFGVTPEQYSLFSATSSIVSLICLFGLMPLMRQVLKLHESTINVLVLTVGAGLVVISALAQELLPGFLVIFSLANVRYLCYPTGRSLLSKMVDDDEVPKMYGFLNVITNTASLVGIPLYRGIYDATLETFPGAFLMLSASLLTCAAFVYFVLVTQRAKIEKINQNQESKRTNENNDQEDISPPDYVIDTHM